MGVEVAEMDLNDTNATSTMDLLFNCRELDMTRA